MPSLNSSTLLWYCCGGIEQNLLNNLRSKTLYTNKNAAIWMGLLLIPNWNVEQEKQTSHSTLFADGLNEKGRLSRLSSDEDTRHSDCSVFSTFWPLGRREHVVVWNSKMSGRSTTVWNPFSYFSVTLTFILEHFPFFNFYVSFTVHFLTLPRHDFLMLIANFKSFNRKIWVFEHRQHQTQRLQTQFAGSVCI